MSGESKRAEVPDVKIPMIVKGGDPSMLDINNHLKP